MNLRQTKLFILMAGLLVSTSLWANNCVSEKARFRELYVALQQSLNYEGKDAALVNGKLILKPHSPDSPYEGKVFEAAIYKEYQHSLKKVAAIYQAAKFEQFDKSNPALVDFLKAIEGNDQAVAEYVKKNKVDQVVDQLQAASKKKFGDSKNPALINDQDKYLLKKLLTHAQDRICSISKFEETEQKTGKQQRQKNFTADELNKIRNAPLNRLINAIKKGNITADSDLKIDELKDTERAINEAIAKNLAALKEWRKKNEKCLKAIANPAFIQSGIQLCNYNLFVQTLDKGSEQNIESLLHFINANERFLKNPAALAETALDEMKLEATIDQTFRDINKKNPACPQFTKKENRIFVSNLKFSEAGGFDLSTVKLSCTRGGKILEPQSCKGAIELASDQNGEGVEVKLKQTGPMQVKLEQLNSCQGADASPAVVLGQDQGSSQSSGTDTSASVSGTATEVSGSGATSGPVLTSSSQTSTPAVRPSVQSGSSASTTDGTVSASGTSVTSGTTATTNTPGVAGTTTPATTGGTSATRPAETSGQRQNTPPQCPDVNGKKQVYNNTTRKCEDKKTAEECKALEKDALKFILNEKENKCEQVKTQADCDKENKDGKTFKLNEKENKCEEVAPAATGATTAAAAALTPQQECDKKIADWNKEQEKEGNTPSIRFVWDDSKKVCEDKQKKEKTETEEEESENGQQRARQQSQGPAPQRFVPFNIPSRQMYILPGMP